LADFDGDGDLDICVLVSQDHEEIWAMVNDGKGNFQPRRLHAFSNFDLGSASILVADLDGDGDADVLLAAGDNLEVNHHHPQPWHGVYWLENLGNWNFAVHHLGAIGGVYSVAVADFDGDGDQDVVAACMFNDWQVPGSASLVFLENDGKQNFRLSQLDDGPVSLATLTAGNFDGDSRPDLVAGSLNLRPRQGRAGRLTLWLSRSEETP
jgi:hypothetical protein